MPINTSPGSRVPRNPLPALIGALLTVVACASPLGSSAVAEFTATAVAPPLPTALPPTALPPSPTPPSPVISADTVSRLYITRTFGEGEATRSLAFTPDGTTLASTGGNTDDFTIRLWDVPSGESTGFLDGHSAIVWQVAFSPDGTLLASVSSDRTAKIWDWRDGKILHTLNFPNQVVSVAFSPEGQTLAVGGVVEWPDAAVWVYSVATWQELGKLEEFWNIPDIAFSPDGLLLAAGGISRNVGLWRPGSTQKIATLSHPGQATTLAMSPDNTVLASGLCESSDSGVCHRGAVWLWSMPSGKLQTKLSDFPQQVEALEFSPDGSLLLAGSRDGTLRAYSASTLALVYEAVSSGGVPALAISPDGRYLVTGRSNGQISLWVVGQ
jgi:WD40 repeat protein